MHVSSVPKILYSIVCILYLLEVWLWGSCLSSNRFHFQLSLLNFFVVDFFFYFQVLNCLFVSSLKTSIIFIQAMLWSLPCALVILSKKKRTGPIGKLLLMLVMILVIVFGAGVVEWRSKACLAVSLTYLLFWKVWMAPSLGIPDRVGG